MSLLRNLFKKKQPASRGISFILNTENVARSIWLLHENQKEIFGHTFKTPDGEIPFTLPLYARATAVYQLKEIESARQSQAKINMNEKASELFCAGLIVLADNFGFNNEGYAEFEPVCNTLVEFYKKELVPIIAEIEKTGRPSVRNGNQVSPLQLLNLVPEPQKTKMGDWIIAAVAYLVYFLNAGNSDSFEFHHVNAIVNTEMFKTTGWW